ncbi:MAG TPA: winged helix DNA-binding domain-containing protein [Actinomycetota bacterium]|nr:winged helix DNA-binding domain-containing protein [Actinomycetota bacterium]
MRSSGLAGPRFQDAVDVVRHHGAVQAQDYGPAKWSIGQRTDGVVDSGVEAALAAGTILRTHVMRPTWHFVAGEDARWLLELTGPLVRRATAARFRQLGLDPKTLDRCEAAVARELEGGNHLTRAEVGGVLDERGIDRSGQRFPHILMHLEPGAVVCSGASRAGAHTYALLDERVPATPARDRDDALAELARRYLTSHGPATANDLRWWSSLSAADVARAHDLLRDELVSTEVEGVVLWSVAEETGRAPRTSRPHLLQTYDELVVGYTRSRFLGDPARAAILGAWRDRTVPGSLVLIDGAVAGYWKRELRGDEVVVRIHARAGVDARGQRALERAAAELGRFLGRRAVLEVRGNGR